MADNIYGVNTSRESWEMSLVSAYITKAPRFYRNPFTLAGLVAPENDFWGFLHTTKGEGIITRKNAPITVHKDEIIYLRYSEMQLMSTQDSEWDFYCIWFYLNGDLPQTFTPMSLPELQNERNIFLEIIRLLNCGSKNYLPQANGLGLYLLGEIQTSLLRSSNNTSSNRIIQEAILYINQNINQPLTVKALARHYHVSEKHFRYLFLREMGVTPKHYIVTVKLNKAAHMLTLDPLSVSEISDALSFPSPSYFITAFKKQFGQTPAAYRKSHGYTSGF